MKGEARPGDSLRRPAILLSAGIGMVLFTYGTPPLADPLLAERLPLLSLLPGDLPLYLWRFLLSFFCLGLFPVAAALLLGQDGAGAGPRGLGLRPPRRPLKLPVLLIGAAACLAAGAAAACDPGVARFYPYSRTLLSLVRDQGFAWFAGHALLYLLLYYLPWELLFRGVLIFPFLPEGAAAPAAGGTAPPLDPRLWAVACFQALPSALLHFGHPLSETLAALPFGIFMGWLAIRTRSILPGLLLHFGIGIATDLFITFRFLGMLP